MDNDPAMIGQIVSENANLRLVGRKALELAEVLRLYHNAGDDGICLSIPEARVVVNDLEASHILLA